LIIYRTYFRTFIRDLLPRFCYHRYSQIHVLHTHRPGMQLHITIATN